jgi:hypothetical protein
MVIKLLLLLDQQLRLDLVIIQTALRIRLLRLLFSRASGIILGQYDISLLHILDLNVAADLLCETLCLGRFMVLRSIIHKVFVRQCVVGWLYTRVIMVLFLFLSFGCLEPTFHLKVICFPLNIGTDDPLRYFH